MLYRRLPHAEAEPSRPHAPLGPSRGIVYKLAALFSLDAFAGGFIAQSLVALWLFQKFEMSVAAASLFFFWSGVLSAFSYPVAARLAGRIGLINTMVYTHIPSSICLILAAFAPSLALTLALLLVRSALSQMDVPTRTSYVMAVVTTAGADRGRERHGGAAQPRILDQPGVRRRAADASVLRAAARFLRQPEDHLRLGAAVHLPARQAAGGKARVSDADGIAPLRRSTIVSM